jgi:hypothetical protein
MSHSFQIIRNSSSILNPIYSRKQINFYHLCSARIHLFAQRMFHNIKFKLTPYLILTPIESPAGHSGDNGSSFFSEHGI